MSENRHAVAIRRAVQITGDALADVDAELPRLRYPLRKRLLWRLRGVPADVRAEQRRVSKKRAELLAARLHERRQ